MVMVMMMVMGLESCPTNAEPMATEGNGLYKILSELTATQQVSAKVE